MMKIPMTVFGGLHSDGWKLMRWRRSSFNTDDGIWRATIRLFYLFYIERTMFQYRWRYLEGYNTVPLSPWGYWPQMSKMENLGDFSDFRPSAPCALFGISPSGAAGSLATQGLAVFGKKTENLRPFWPAKRFSTFCSIPSWKDFVNFSQDGSIKNDFLYWGKGNSPGEFFLKGRVPFSRLRSRMGYAIMEGAKTTMWYKKGAPLCYQHRRAPLYHSSHCDYQSRCDSLIGTTLPIK